MPQLTYEDVQTVIGQTLVDRNGDRFGKIVDIYLDRDTQQPEWILVNSGLFGTKESFVPAANAARTGEGMQAGYEKDMIRDAPRAEPDGELSQDEEATLYRHYGLEYSEESSDSGLAGGRRNESPLAGRGDTVAKVANSVRDNVVSRIERMTGLEVTE